MRLKIDFFCLSTHCASEAPPADLTSLEGSSPQILKTSFTTFSEDGHIIIQDLSFLLKPRAWRTAEATARITASCPTAASATAVTAGGMLISSRLGSTMRPGRSTVSNLDRKGCAKGAQNELEFPHPQLDHHCKDVILASDVRCSRCAVSSKVCMHATHPIFETQFYIARLVCMERAKCLCIANICLDEAGVE